MRAAPVLFLAALVCGLSGAACGKKGPPLAPIVRIPAAIEQVNARRVGDDVYVTVRVPTQNIDASMPVDVRRVEVYGVTATTPPPRGRFVEIAKLVGTVTVPPPSPDAAAGTPVPGAMITVRDTLAAEDLVPRELPAQRPAGRRPTLPSLPEPRGEVQRFYAAVAFSTRGRPGPPGNISVLSLAPLPEVPEDVEVSYTSTSVMVSWQPSGGLIGFLLNQSLPPEPPPFDEFVPPTTPAPPLPLDRSVTPGARPGQTGTSPVPTATAAAPVPPLPTSATPSQSQGSALLGPTRYNVYRELTVDPLLLPPTVEGKAEARPEAPLAPVNMAPLDALMFVDEVEFERERCYVIRAVRGATSNVVEGFGSERRCIRPVDIFPPEPPVGLSAVGAESAISLIWEANTEDDVAGYLILRGASADDTLLPITAVPIVETQFTDRNVSPGDRYVYAVVAVDSRVPLPNVSAESMRVEEIAR